MGCSMNNLLSIILWPHFMWLIIFRLERLEDPFSTKSYTHLKFNSSPLKSYRFTQKETGSSSNHHFSGVNSLLNFGGENWHGKLEKPHWMSRWYFLLKMEDFPACHSLENSGGLVSFILLMVQKSPGQPPEMFFKPFFIMVDFIYRSLNWWTLPGFLVAINQICFVIFTEVKIPTLIATTRHRLLCGDPLWGKYGSWFILVV